MIGIRILRRLGGALVSLVTVTIIVFALIHLAPGDPISAGDDPESHRGLSAAARDELRALYRLDEPLHRRYIGWLGDIVRGDLGRSFQDHRAVSEKIAARARSTILLNALAILVMLGIGVPLGALAAQRQGSAWDHGTGVAAAALNALPVFWCALMLQIAFSVELRWLPLYGLRSGDAASRGLLWRGLDAAAHLVLPVTCLSYGAAAYVSRFVRASLLDSSAPEAWRAARARGLAPFTIWRRHGLTQAALPLLTLAGLLVPALFGGSVIVERVFAIDGLGLLFLEAASRRDVPVVMGLTLLAGCASVIGMLAADLAYGWIDPRVRRAR